LSVIVLLVCPRGVGPPVLGYEVLELLLRVGVRFWNIDLVLLEPALQLLRIPVRIF
jgi:hypothetical protein